MPSSTVYSRCRQSVHARSKNKIISMRHTRKINGPTNGVHRLAASPHLATAASRLESLLVRRFHLRGINPVCGSKHANELRIVSDGMELWKVEMPRFVLVAVIDSIVSKG